MSLCIVVVVCLASGWGWLSIATPSAARPGGSTPLILPKGELLGGPEESLCWSTVHTTFSHEPGYTRIIPYVGDTVLWVIRTRWHPWRPSVTSQCYIRISTYMLTLVTSEVPRSLSLRKPRRFPHTHSRLIFPRYWTGDVLSYGTMTRRRLYFFEWV